MTSFKDSPGETSDDVIDELLETLGMDESDVEDVVVDVNGEISGDGN